MAGELVEVNCATLRGDAAMSTLFGHVRGAYTGAVEARAGMLRKADKGVLFLDEIGELGLDEQAMLLRAIEDKTFFPVGSDREVAQRLPAHRRHQPRSVGAGGRAAASARTCWRASTCGPSTLPGLRERPEDIEPNLDFELERVGDALKLRLTMSREARERYLAFARSPEALWSGNFRDFGASVRRMATLCEGGRISVQRGGGRDGAACGASGARRSRREAGDARQPARRACCAPDAPAALDRFDRVQLEDVLRVCRSARSLSEAGRAAVRRLARGAHAPPTTPIACASTWPATACPCRRSSRPDLGVKLRDHG